MSNDERIPFQKQLPLRIGFAATCCCCAVAVAPWRLAASKRTMRRAMSSTSISNLHKSATASNVYGYTLEPLFRSFILLVMHSFKSIGSLVSPELTGPTFHGVHCPPRRWSEAGVGVGLLSGIPLLSAN